jgi:hypothetical protein
MFSGIEFCLFTRGKLPIFRFQFFLSRVTFQTYQLVYYKLFGFVSFIAKISFILFVSCFINSLPAMGAHERPLFEKLLWGLVSSTIFVRC